MTKPRIWYIPTSNITERVFTAQVYQQMLEEFEVTVNETNQGLTTEQVSERIAGYDGLVTLRSEPGSCRITCLRGTAPMTAPTSRRLAR